MDALVYVLTENNTDAMNITDKTFTMIHGGLEFSMLISQSIVIVNSSDTENFDKGVILIISDGHMIVTFARMPDATRCVLRAGVGKHGYLEDPEYIIKLSVPYTVQFIQSARDKLNCRVLCANPKKKFSMRSCIGYVFFTHGTLKSTK